MPEHATDIVKAAGMCPHGNFPATCKNCAVEAQETREISAEGWKLVREAPVITGGKETFNSLSGSVENEWMRPLFFQLGEVVPGAGMEQAAKVIPTMGRAAFIERETSFDGENFHFLQWKGVGKNPYNLEIQHVAQEQGRTVEYPLGNKGLSPLMLVSAEGRAMLRFVGASCYEDLVIEAKNQERFSTYGLRMPKILGTMKFSREFCAAQGLPLPETDDPEDFRGQTFEEFLETHREEIKPEVWKRMMAAGELKSGYTSAILGQNVRAFRNVWRAEDVERILADADVQAKKQNIETVFDTSRQILGQELEKELDRQEFAKEFARTLGEQTAILIANDIDHGSLSDLKQNITLAGEVVDFDATEVVDKARLEDENNWPDWVKEDPSQKSRFAEDWKQQKKDELYRQVYYVASHLKPVLDGLAVIDGEGETMTQDVAKAFVAGLQSRLPPERLAAIVLRLEERQDLDKVDGIYTSYDGTVDERKRQNFEGCQEIFDRVSQCLREK